MSYLNGQNIKHAAKAARYSRVKARYIKKFGTSGSESLFALTGKQASRYGRAMAQNNIARYGQTYRP